MIYYELTQEELDNDYSEKSWDEKTYLIKFQNQRTNGDEFEVNVNDMATVLRILKENNREFTIEPNIRLLY